jgi:16S rRNA processing protein RimM
MVRLVVARIGRAHGIRGEVTIEVRTDLPERRFVPGAVLDVVPPAARGSQPQRLPPALTLASVRDHNGTLLLAFDGVGDRTAAETLKGALLEVEVPDDPAEDDDEDAWYDHQLVGLAAIDPAGARLGEVVAVEHAPAQDLLVVRRPDGRRRLVPFVSAIVPVVDVGAGTLTIDAPPGLLDDTLEPGGSAPAAADTAADTAADPG